MLMMVAYEGHVDHRIGQELHVIVLSRERVSLLQEFFNNMVKHQMNASIFLLHILQSFEENTTIYEQLPLRHTPLLQKGQSIGDNRIEICSVVHQGGAGL